jgi:hypothetical protein
MNIIGQLGIAILAALGLVMFVGWWIARSPKE